jgi:hypothetical protein
MIHEVLMHVVPVDSSIGSTIVRQTIGFDHPPASESEGDIGGIGVYIDISAVWTVTDSALFLPLGNPSEILLS